MENPTKEQVHRRSQSVPSSRKLVEVPTNAIDSVQAHQTPKDVERKKCRRMKKRKIRSRSLTLKLPFGFELKYEKIYK